MSTLQRRRTAVTTTAIACALVATASWADLHGPYWGTWEPDPAASTHAKTLKAAVDPNSPPAPPPVPAAIAEELPLLRINDEGHDFIFEYLEDDGSVISSTKITVDGKENVNSRAGGALVHRSTSGWDGSTLRTSWRLEQSGGAVVISGTDRWDFVHPDTLRLTAETEDARSTSRSVIVYQRRPPGAVH